MQRQDFSKLELKKTKASKLGRKRGLADVAGATADGPGVVETADTSAGVAVADVPEKPKSSKRSRHDADVGLG